MARKEMLQFALGRVGCPDLRALDSAIPEVVLYYLVATKKGILKKEDVTRSTLNHVHKIFFESIGSYQGASIEDAIRTHTTNKMLSLVTVADAETLDMAVRFLSLSAYEIALDLGAWPDYPSVAHLFDLLSLYFHNNDPLSFAQIRGMLEALVRRGREFDKEEKEHPLSPRIIQEYPRKDTPIQRLAMELGVGEEELSSVHPRRMLGASIRLHMRKIGGQRTIPPPGIDVERFDGWVFTSESFLDIVNSGKNPYTGEALPREIVGRINGRRSVARRLGLTFGERKGPSITSKEVEQRVARLVEINGTLPTTKDGRNRLLRMLGYHSMDLEEDHHILATKWAIYLRVVSDTNWIRKIFA